MIPRRCFLDDVLFFFFFYKIKRNYKIKFSSKAMLNKLKRKKEKIFQFYINNFKIINFSENLILADFYFFFPYAKILNENDVSLIKKIVKGDNKLRRIKSKA